MTEGKGKKGERSEEKGKRRRGNGGEGIITPTWQP